jgi:hypothetical protein
MADAEENYWGLEMERRAEKKCAAERKRAKRAGRGVAGLKKEAAKQVRKKSKELVGALMEKALQGHVASAKLVVELAEVQPVEEAKAKRKKRGLSEAERLALEPPWVDPNPKPERQWWQVGGDEGTRDQGNEGAGEQGNEGAGDQGTEGLRD